MSNVEDGDAEEQTRQIWRKNVPYLYDVMMTKELAWPTLTVEWLPERRYDADKECNVHRLLIGTHTGGEETNHVIVAEVYLPPQPERLNMKLYDSATEEVGGYNRTDACVALKAETGADGKIYDKAKVRLVHEAEVLTARGCPQNPNVLATKPGGTSDVLVFDLRLHFWDPKQSTECTPNLRLQNQRKDGEGSALAWSPWKEGLLATSGSDGGIDFYDLEHAVSSSEEGVRPRDAAMRHHHGALVEDVAFHLHDPHILGSASDDKIAALWDTRPAVSQAALQLPHEDEVNSIAFTPFNPLVVVTGCSNGTAAVWDLRRPKEALHTFSLHAGPVYKVRFAPFHETVLASAGADGRVLLWDLAKIGEPAIDGLPAALLFAHDGHMSPINDIGWGPHAGDEWLMASASENNRLHIWRLADRLRRHS